MTSTQHPVSNHRSSSIACIDPAYSAPPFCPSLSKRPHYSSIFYLCHAESLYHHRAVGYRHRRPRPEHLPTSWAARPAPITPRLNQSPWLLACGNLFPLTVRGPRRHKVHQPYSESSPGGQEHDHRGYGHTEKGCCGGIVCGF